MAIDHLDLKLGCRLGALMDAAERLASPRPADNRISCGCIDAPVAFQEQPVRANLTRQNAVIDVHTDSISMQEVFGKPAAEPRWANGLSTLAADQTTDTNPAAPQLPR